MKKLIVVGLAVVLALTLAAPAAAGTSYHLHAHEAKKLLLRDLRSEGYEPETMQYTYCGNITPSRMHCDVYFDDLDDGKVYCGGASVWASYTKYSAGWHLSTKGCEYY